MSEQAWKGFKRFFTTELEEKSLGVILFQLTFPFLLSFLGLLIIYEYCVTLYSGDMFWTLGALMLAYFFPPAGKESLIPIAISKGIPYYLIALALSFIDAMVSLFLIWNYDYAKKIPFFGYLLKYVEKKGREIISESKWLSKFTFIVLVLFVMIPFQGTGGAGATVIGRMIGMNPYKVLSAVIIGALLGTFLVALLSKSAIETLKVGTTGVLVALLAVLLPFYFYNYYLKGKRKRVVDNES